MPAAPVPGLSEAALAELVRQHHRLIRGYIAALVFDQESVDDLAQEVFLRACTHAGRLASPSEFAPWLRGIAKNVVHEHVRASYRQQRFTAVVEECLVAEVGEVPEWQGDTIAGVRTCLAGLSERARRLVELRYGQDQSAEEIGQELGMQGGTVRVALLRAREALLACLRNQLGAASLPAGGR